MEDKMVSVIIPIRRGENIDLDSIRASTYKDTEIIIVDEGLERSAQRNIGIKRSKGEYLLILDSDQSISPGLIEECVDLMKDGYSAVYIPEIITTKGWFAYIRNWERQFYTATPVDVVRFVIASMCPKFNENMCGPEDSDWDRRCPILKTTSKNPLYHNEKKGIINYFKKKAYYSKSMAEYHRNNPDDQVLDFKWRCFGVFFERGKWRRVLRRPDLMLAVWGIIFIRGLIYKWITR